jgi:hypothetical protein
MNFTCCIATPSPARPCSTELIFTLESNAECNRGEVPPVTDRARRDRGSPAYNYYLRHLLSSRLLPPLGLCSSLRSYLQCALLLRGVSQGCFVVAIITVCYSLGRSAVVSFVDAACLQSDAALFVIGQPSR